MATAYQQPRFGSGTIAPARARPTADINAFNKRKMAANRKMTWASMHPEAAAYKAITY